MLQLDCLIKVIGQVMAVLAYTYICIYVNVDIYVHIVYKHNEANKCKYAPELCLNLKIN